jgi:hypothetical protein
LGLRFEWDASKARANASKHRVTFEEALTVFGDPLSLTIPDSEHSHGEQRFVTVGQSRNGRLLVVGHADGPGGTISIITARRATRKERSAYQEG